MLIRRLRSPRSGLAILIFHFRPQYMNLLFLTYQGDIAGATNSIAYLTKGLADRGHQVYMGCREESLLYRMLENTKVHRIPMHFRGKIDFPLMRRLRDVIKEYDIELINAQSSLDRYTSVFARWRYGLDVKVVHTRRQMSLSMGGLLNKLIYYRGTDKIIAVSEPVKASLVKQGIPASHLQVIHNGTPIEKYSRIDEKKIQELKEKLHIQEGDIVIGCCARLKHQVQILQALQYVKEKTKVIFVGIDEQEEFKKYYDLLPHEIHIMGDNVPNEEALHYIKLFTINILPSTMEGLSQSLLEAMALGIPVIATAFAGNLDLIKNEENGLLFDHENIHQLAEKIELLIHQPGLRKKLATAGQKTAMQDFNIERTIDNYEAFFAELTSRKN